MSRTTSYGTCTLCGKRTTKAGMSRHLATCAAEHDGTGPRQRLFRLRVEDAYSPLYWLDLEIPATKTLGNLDNFLRTFWLECCGHLSSFTIGDTDYTVIDDDDDFGFGALGLGFGKPEEKMDRTRLSKVLQKDTKLSYTYDFGSSTDLKLRVVDERKGSIGNEPVRLLSRNEAPEWVCEICGNPATTICLSCAYDRDNPFYCEAHAENHPCGEDMEMQLPVVNSPRMGVCGFDGTLHSPPVGR